MSRVVNIIRYRVAASERRAIDEIAGQMHPLAADAPVEPPAGVVTILTSRIRSACEVAHSLRLENFSSALEGLEGLRKVLASTSPRSGRRPVVILENMPLDGNAPAILLLAGTLIGEVREYLGHGSAVVEVSGHHQATNVRPSSDNNLEFKLHTDMSFYPTPPSVVVFLMMTVGHSGGQSIFCDPLPIIERLPSEAFTALRRPFRFPPPPHASSMDPQFFPILESSRSDITRVRFRGDGLEALDSRQEYALKVWNEEIDAHEVEVSLLPGEMAIFSNTHLLHGRREFQDRRDLGQQRRALRAYVDFAGEESQLR